jgi:hypothetical protein
MAKPPPNTNTSPEQNHISKLKLKAKSTEVNLPVDEFR